VQDEIDKRMQAKSAARSPAITHTFIPSSSKNFTPKSYTEQSPPVFFLFQFCDEAIICKKNKPNLAIYQI
jgi:hypothetical protein